MRGTRCVECGAKHRAKGLCAYHYYQHYQQRPEVKASLKAYRKEYQKRYAVQRKKRVKAKESYEKHGTRRKTYDAERSRSTVRSGTTEKHGLIQNLKNRFRVFEQKIKNALT